MTSGLGVRAATISFVTVAGLVLSGAATAVPSAPLYVRPSPYTVPEAPPLCDAVVCVHYVTTTDDAPPLTDADGNGVPDEPEAVLAAFQRAWPVEFGTLGFAAPPPDQGAGGDDRYDVYLENRTGQAGGVTVPELDLPDGNSTSRIYLASNLSQSLMVGPQDLTSVAAHELGHAAQFAVSSDSIGQRFFDESMATWLQEEVVPGSALDLVESSQFATPDLPLDYNVGADEFGFDAQVYAQWIFFDHLADRFGTEVIRQMLEASRPPGVWEVTAMDSALRLHGSSLARAYVGFTKAILDPARSFGFKKKVPYQAFADLKLGQRVSRSAKLDHLSHWRYSVKPRPGSRVARAAARQGQDRPRVLRCRGGVRDAWAEAAEARLAHLVPQGRCSGGGATGRQARPKRHDHPRQQLVGAVSVRPGHALHVRWCLPGGRDKVPRAGPGHAPVNDPHRPPS